MAKNQSGFEEQFEKAANRFICRKCDAQYRLQSDAEEHLRVGCKIKPAKKKAHSLKSEPDAAPQE